MSHEMAEARGRVTLRPWRVGVLIDATSIDQVRKAIAQLSSVWGGRYMPILDLNSPIEELERLARAHDLDSVYTDVDDDTAVELVKRLDRTWRGRGPWGPFGEGDGLRKGLLPIQALVSDTADLLQPSWDSDQSFDLALAATWGLADMVPPPTHSRNAIRLRTAPISQLNVETQNNTLIGTVEATGAHLELQPRAHSKDGSSVYIMRPDHPQDVAEFWNMRAYGRRIVGIPAENPDNVVDFLLSNYGFPTAPSQVTEKETRGVIPTWGIADASSFTAATVRDFASRHGLSIEQRQRGNEPHYAFQGLRTRFTRSARGDFRPDAHWVDINLPSLPINDEPDSFGSGVIAAEVQWHSVVGQDPRLTAVLPPFPREASLLDRISLADGIDQCRVTLHGVALGIDAERDHVRVPFAFNQEAFRLLFNDDEVRVTQSEVGRFQARAAEKFGGPFTELFSQPGVRAAIDLAARRSGVALPHLRGIVANNRGEWPDPLFGPKLDEAEYAKRAVNNLFLSGIFVPTLRVHCSYCRVERYVGADDLGATMMCEFCGQEFNLAMSHSLAQPEWRYRLAAHLGSDQVQAFVPALATASFLQQMRVIEEPPMTHVLGLEITIQKRTIEVDLAAYIRDHDWTVVLAEIKAGNRIDANDVENLEFLRQKLADAGVRCLLMFATLKDRLSPEETTILRALAERSPTIPLAQDHRSTVNFPMVLTASDLSHPRGSQKHPWRWNGRGSGLGLFETSQISCQRNLGLTSYQANPDSAGGRIVCDWID